MPTPSFPQRLAALKAKGSAALLRFVRNPRLSGATDEHLRYWAAANEARYAEREGNSVFASSLLPVAGQEVVVGEGIPLLPAGVRWAVDEAKEGIITVTVNLAASAGLTVRVSSPQGTVIPAVLTPGTTRTTIDFPAGQDGLYTVALLTGGTPLLTLTIPVTRALFRALREDSRALGYQFSRALPPTPSADYRLRLALLVCAESAAHTRQGSLADSLLAAAAAVPAAATPTALYPFRRG